MGQNNRYPAHSMDRSIDEVVIRPEPISLTDAELRTSERPPTAAEVPVRVRAFVRFHEATIRPECEAIAWTDKAVQVRFTVGGATRAAWVWANAVERIPGT